MVLYENFRIKVLFVRNIFVKFATYLLFLLTMKTYQINRIKDLMVANGFTVKQIASKCNITSMTINRLLNNPEYNPTTDTIERIAEALGVHEQYIYEAETESNAKMHINGFVEYGGTVYTIKTINQLDKLYEIVKKDKSIPSLIKKIKEQDEANISTQSKTPIDINAIDLFQFEKYDTAQLYTWSFRKSDDEKDELKNDLGNMCQGYPFQINNEPFHNSECAYICGLFSQNTTKSVEIQRELQSSENGYEAKKSIRKKYEQVGLGRDDWEHFNVQWMLYVVWQKVKQNHAFASKLKKIPDNAIIVENSTFQKSETSSFWGMKNDAIKEATELLEREAEINHSTAKKKVVDEAKMKARNSINHIGVWEGCNCMGKILTICRHCILHHSEPPIDYKLLGSKRIYLFGQLLTFDC